MLNPKQEINKLIKKYPDPRKGGVGYLEFLWRQDAKSNSLRYGTVVDNKDPEFLGRVRVASDVLAPGAVTPWIPIVNTFATNKAGWWQLPDIGTQVVMAFVGEGHSNPVVLGCLYDEKNKPPKHSTAKAADSFLYQTKSGRLEFIDEEGKESLILSMAEGKMRFVMTNGKGIELINELGDIKIKCKKLKIEGKEGINITAKKKFKLTSNDKITIKAKKAIKLECEKEVKLKGKNIKIDASKGITSEGKQLAAEGDKVQGFDIHNVMYQAGLTIATMPLPHPFLGKLVDKLSKDVKINGHNAAVKGSIAKHDYSMYNLLPGILNFQTPPKKEGEVYLIIGAKT